MFRRRSSSQQPAPEEEQHHDQDTKGATAKGRPTPKRREAERHRRTYVQAPKDRKEAAQRLRERQRGGRQDHVRAMRGGDESKLPPRDAGPVRRLVRDVVDSRRGAGSYFLIITLVVLIVQILLSVATSNHMLSAATSARIQLFLMYAWYLSIVFVAIDSFILVRRMKAMVRERHPDANERGLTMYAVMRALQIRRLRLPPAKVKPGDEVRGPSD
ncbi:MAG: DUF3043 domain-containing protein [Streptosporangiales bacterium]